MTEDLDHPHVVTLLEGMQNYLSLHASPSTLLPSLLYSRGCDWTDTIETDFKKNGDVRAWEYEILHRKVDAGEAGIVSAIEMLKLGQSPQVQSSYVVAVAFEGL